MIRPAATLCALRASEGRMEVLMVRRAADASFVAGGFVFPGGALEDCDRSPLASGLVEGVSSAEMLPWVAAALREAFEETGLLMSVEPAGSAASALRPLRGWDFYQALAAESMCLDGGSVAYLSNWVGPPTVARRFDTRFFVTEVSAPDLTPDGAEVTEALWVEPEVALRRGDDGTWSMLFPTRSHLELLSRFKRPAEVVDYARSRPVVPIEPTRGPNGGVRLPIDDEQGSQP
ncbi:MAG: NUDIX domain-containing protein [Acidimicrobiia bacterium]